MFLEFSKHIVLELERPFPTELFDEVRKNSTLEMNSALQQEGKKMWMDRLASIKYAINIIGVTQLMMMKADVLSDLDYIKICTLL